MESIKRESQGTTIHQNNEILLNNIYHILPTNSPGMLNSNTKILLCHLVEEYLTQIPDMSSSMLSIKQLKWGSGGV